MQLRRGDMWSVYNEADVFLVTTNAVLTHTYRLVMGAGIAREALERYPGLDWVWGYRLYSRYWQLYERHQLPIYGVLWPMKDEKLAAFQTKYHWREKANLDIVTNATWRLRLVAERHPNKRFHLNFPGIGLGGLHPEEVLPTLAILPDNVVVWKK